MHFSVAAIAALFAVGALAGPITARDSYDQYSQDQSQDQSHDRDHDNEGGLKKICPGLNTMENGCIRCTSSRDMFYALDYYPSHVAASN